jgi:hypothetical protein
LHGRGWSKNQVFWHSISETARMILSILYTMICISRYVRCSKGYEHSYDDRWTIVRIFLCTFEELRICSVWRSDKLFIAMCYIGFVTYTGKILISILGYLFWVIRWHNKMEESSMMTWMSSNVKHCDRYCNEGSVYNRSRSGKRTRCSSKCASTM